jgi:hypothetical protein
VLTSPAGRVRENLVEKGKWLTWRFRMIKRSPFRYFFMTSPDIYRLAVMLHVRGIDVSHETIQFWWHRFWSLIAAEIRRKRVQQHFAHSNRSDTTRMVGNDGRGVSL